MPMEKENHEALLNELMQDDLDHSRKTEILQELRADYGSVLSDFDDLTQAKEKLEKDNSDLVVSNSKLFRELGTVDNSPEQNQQEQQKAFSDTVTLEDLEGGDKS